MGWRLVVLCVVSWLSGALGQSGVDLGGLKVEARITFVGNKYEAKPEGTLQDSIKRYMNAQIYNVNCESYSTGNQLFPANVQTAMPTCVRGDGVRITGQSDGTTGTWSMQYRVYVVETQTYSTVDKPTICMSVNDVNRFRTWAMATLRYSDVRFSCAIDTTPQVYNSTVVKPQPCMCGDPNMLPPAAVTTENWKNAAIGGLTVMSILTCALAGVLYAQRAARNAPPPPPPLDENGNPIQAGAPPSFGQYGSGFQFVEPGLKL